AERVGATRRARRDSPQSDFGSPDPTYVQGGIQRSARQASTACDGGLHFVSIVLGRKRRYLRQLGPWAERPSSFSAPATGYPAWGAASDQLAEFVAHAETAGCIDLSELAEVTESMSDAEADVLTDRLEELGVEISDDCGRPRAEATSYRNAE